MNVTGAVFDGLDEHEIDQLDNRAFLAAFHELVEVDFLLAFLGQLDIGNVDVLQNRVNTAADLRLGVVEEIDNSLLGAD